MGHIVGQLFPTYGIYAVNLAIQQYCPLLNKPCWGVILLCGQQVKPWMAISKIKITQAGLYITYGKC